VVLAAAASCALAGCGPNNPVLAPVAWWHDLQGGEIAASRPPPPGADLPYPHVFTIPPKPQLPSDAFRQTVQTELAQDRDTTERLAARTPIDMADLPPPPPLRRAPAAPAPAADTANATLPAADAPAPKQAATAPAAAPDGGPAPGTPLAMAGAPPDQSALPAIPAAPPSPPDFEHSEAPPAAPVLPVPPPPVLPGSVRVLFATGNATLAPSQRVTLRDIAQQRGKGAIAVEGHGEASADAPGAQQQAVGLGLQRAAAIAAALTQLHVPADRIVLSATAFGRDASVKVQ
jgi:outer membrane protein OmpA-like peptidoglycan-associated protein